MTWFYYSLGAMILFVAYNLLSRVLAVRSDDPRAFTILFNAVAGACALILFTVEAYHTPSLTPYSLILTGTALALWTIFARTEYAAKKLVEASTLTVIVRIAPAVTLIVSAIFLKESITFYKVLALILIAAANILVLHNSPHLKAGKGLVISLNINGIFGNGLGSG